MAINLYMEKIYDRLEYRSFKNIFYDLGFS